MPPQSEGAWPADFPPEEDWLELPAGEVAPDFVQRTWSRVQREVYGRAASDDDVLLQALAAHRVPEPSADFVAVTLARVQRDASPAWKAFLAKYLVPQPSANFVDRVLAALREPSAVRGPRPSATPARGFRPRPGWTWLAAAMLGAVALGLFGWLRPVNRTLPFERLAAEAFTPDPWATALSARFHHGLRVRRADAALHLAALAGLQEEQ